MTTAYLGTGIERVADVRLATDIPAQHLGTTVNAIRTSGYSAHGRGPGQYVNDAQANAGLAAAHPRICKQSADGRYWRLSVEDGLNVLQLGAAADNTADDGPIAVAALAYLEHVANTQAAIGYGRGAPRLVFPAGNYFLGTSTLDIRYSAIIEGDNGGGPSGGGSTLRWADNTTGIRTQSYNTEGASADAGVNHLGSAGTIIRNLYLRGGYAGTESESHGVQLRCPARLEHLIIDNFGGDGVFGKAGVGSNPYRGQTNGSAFFNVAVIQCRNGFFFDLSDSNNVNFYSCTLNSNRRYGAWHNTGLNVNWVGCDFSTNGSDPAFISKCSYSGKWYYCLPGQEAWASANAPSGTTANNTGWGWMAGPGTVAPEFPAWSNGMTVRAAGSFRADGVGQQGMLHNVYVEGDQPWPLAEGMWFSAGTPLRLFEGSVHGGQLTFTTTTPKFGSSLEAGNALFVRGNTYLGPENATPTTNGLVRINNTGGYSSIAFDDAGTQRGVIELYNGGGFYSQLSNGSHYHHFYTGGSLVGRIGSDGYRFPDGSIQSTAATSSGVSDGDKGDITVSGGGTAWAIDAGSVSLAKMANVATGTVFYRKTAANGAPEVQSLATLKTDLGLTGTNSGDQTSIAGISGTLAQFNAAVTDADLLSVAAASAAYQPLDGQLTDFAGLAYASNGLKVVRVNAAESGLELATIGGGGGSPGGASGELQYNNAGAFAGAANVEVEGGNLKLVSTADPAAPAGGLLLYSKNVAGRHLPKIVGPSGIDTVLQVGLHGNSVFMVAPASGTTAPTAWGGTLTTATTMSLQQTIASANPWLATARKRFATGSTAFQGSGMRTAYAQWFRGNAAGFGGFFFRAQFGQNANLNGAQCFVGLCASTAVLATTAGAVGALLNMIGVGYDTTDGSGGNWQLFRNDGAGTATKVDLGATNAARNTTYGFDLIIHCPPGAATEIFVRVINIHSGAVVLDTSYTTDLPAVNTGMAFKAEINNGAVSTATNLEVAKVYIESDY